LAKQGGEGGYKMPLLLPCAAQEPELNLTGFLLCHHDWIVPQGLQAEAAVGILRA